MADYNQSIHHNNFWKYPSLNRYKKLKNIVVYLIDNDIISSADLFRACSNKASSVKSWRFAVESTWQKFINPNGNGLAKAGKHLSTILCVVLEIQDIPENIQSAITELATPFKQQGLHKVFNRDVGIHVAFPDQVETTYRVEDIKKIFGGMRISRPPQKRDKPIFPAFSPGKISTHMLPYKSERFEQLWIKDESQNITGCHKDRLALEHIAKMRARIEDDIREKGLSDRDVYKIPQMSIISAGSAAFALQVLLRIYGLPPLKVIVDPERIGIEVIDALEAIGAQVYQTDLDVKYLDTDAVMNLTDNQGGYDITSRNPKAAGSQNFYDWLVCESLSHQETPPSHIFVPVGSGDLFANFLHILEQDAKSTKDRDPRLQNIHGHDSLLGIGVYGATTYQTSSSMKKLYADKNHRPGLDDLNSWISELKMSSVIDERSGIFEVTDPEVTTTCREAESRDIRTEESGIAGLSLCQNAEKHGIKIGKCEKIVCVNTGWLNIDRH